MAMTRADLTSLAPAQCGFHDLASKAVLKDILGYFGPLSFLGSRNSVFWSCTGSANLAACHTMGDEIWEAIGAA